MVLRNVFMQLPSGRHAWAEALVGFELSDAQADAAIAQVDVVAREFEDHEPPVAAPPAEYTTTHDHIA